MLDPPDIALDEVAVLGVGTLSVAHTASARVAGAAGLCSRCECFRQMRDRKRHALGKTGPRGRLQLEILESGGRRALAHWPMLLDGLDLF